MKKSAVQLSQTVLFCLKLFPLAKWKRSLNFFV